MTDLDAAPGATAGFADFAAAMALTPDGPPGPDGVRSYAGALDATWTIGPKVHGGTMLALTANAARLAVDEPAFAPVAVSANFLWAPDPGPVQLRAQIRRRGRRVSLVDVELAQDDRTAVRASITLAEPETGSDPLLSVHPIGALMSAEPPARVAQIATGHPMADIVHLSAGCDIRPVLRTLSPAPDGQAPAIQYWVRPRVGVTDVLFALVCGDISAPVTVALGRWGWAPTVQLTAYVRAVPADGWLRVLCTTTEIGQGWFDEDHLVVDSAGRVVVQSRQLALVPRPTGPGGPAAPVRS